MVGHWCAWTQNLVRTHRLTLPRMGPVTPKSSTTAHESTRSLSNNHSVVYPNTSRSNVWYSSVNRRKHWRENTLPFLLTYSRRAVLRLLGGFVVAVVVAVVVACSLRRNSPRLPWITTTTNYRHTRANLGTLTNGPCTRPFWQRPIVRNKMMAQRQSLPSFLVGRAPNVRPSRRTMTTETPSRLPFCMIRTRKSWRDEGCSVSCGTKL